MLFAAVTLLSSGLVVYATTTLFSQTFPSQTFTTASLSQNNCSPLVLEYASTLPSFAGSPATLIYSCSLAPITVGDAAFSTTGTTSNTVTVTPTFSVPSGWALGLDKWNGNCASPTTLTSATPITLTGGSFFAYCLTTTSASNFTSFSITWSQ